MCVSVKQVDKLLKQADKLSITPGYGSIAQTLLMRMLHLYYLFSFKCLLCIAACFFFFFQGLGKLVTAGNAIGMSPGNAIGSGGEASPQEACHSSGPKC